MTIACHISGTRSFSFSCLVKIFATGSALVLQTRINVFLCACVVYG